MADAKQCDRCKEFYTDEDMSGLPYSVADKENEIIDLCKNCKYDLEDFMDNFKGRKRTKTKGTSNWSPESKKAQAERMSQRQAIATLLKPYYENKSWGEIIAMASKRIKISKEQEVTFEELKKSIERSLENKKPKCVMCGDKDVDSAGKMCKKCDDEWAEYQNNK